jgi:hypothetical protein
MATTFPFMTAYDPPGTSEGTLDPLGLYQIADQLAIQLVPAVRERMQRIRFLTAMAVGAVVTEGLESDQRNRDASPQLVWEWLVVEALIREMAGDSAVWGVPGTLVAKRALAQHGYLDARSYLKTPGIFGIHGVYKRLATHLGLIDVHLGPGPNADKLVDAWARDRGFAGLNDARQLLARWTAAIRRSLDEKPPRTNPKWDTAAWRELAEAFAPAGSKFREKRCLRELLHAVDEKRLGALQTLWQLQPEFENSNTFREEALHNRLEQREPDYASLLNAIRGYEAFARSLQDAFDVLKAEAARFDAQGFAVPWIAGDGDFKTSVTGLHERFDAAHKALGEVNTPRLSLQHLFEKRFTAFAEPIDGAACALALCTHHETIQRGKSADGKRPWFDRLGQDRIYIRHAYRQPRRGIEPDRYLHDYRGWPIRHFYFDLS